MCGQDEPGESSRSRPEYDPAESEDEPDAEVQRDPNLPDDSEIPDEVFEDECKPREGEDSAAKDESERKPRRQVRRPQRPSKAQRDRHECAGHCPFQAWCRWCVSRD